MAEYSAAATDWAERDRLDSLGRGLDPATIRMLDALGVGPGWRCAEIGAGAGTIATWLHGRVQPDGQVLATDLETRWLDMLDLPDLEIRRHDIAAEGLGEGLYDLIHCRLVLMHVADWRRALQHMVTALRPGGWLLVEDGDFGCAGDSHPPCPALEQLLAAFRELIQKAGGHPYIGRQLVSACHEVGLVDIDGGAAQILGGFRGELLAMGQPLGAIVVEAGLVSTEDLDTAYAYLGDSRNFTYGFNLVSIQGRKPAAG
jgi:SAM-dependent methyltransferase